MSADTTASPGVGATAGPTLPPDASWRRLVVVFAVTQTVGYGALIQSFTVLLLPMSQDLGVSRTAVAAAATISTLVGAVAAIPVGALLDRYGGRALMTTGSIIGVGAVVLWSRAESVTDLYTAFVLVGLALAMSTYEAAFAVIVVVAQARNRDTAIVAITMITGLGTSFYYPLAGWLEGQLGWRTTLLVLAASVAVIVVPAHVLAVPGRARHRCSAPSRTGVRVGEALRDLRFWLLGLAFVAESAATAAFLMIMVTYFRDIGHSAGVAASLPVVVGVVQITARLALAPLARRFGMARVTAVAFTVQGLGMLALPLVGLSIPLTLLCVAGFAVGYSIGVVARPSIVADTFGVAQFASILAIMGVPIALARAGAPLLAAYLADWRFLVLLGTATVLSAFALIPVIRARAKVTT